MALCPKKMRLLYLCDADGGGIAEYAIRQFHALQNAGVHVTFLCRPTFDLHRLKPLDVMAALPAARTRHPLALRRLVEQVYDTRSISLIAADVAGKGGFDALLNACYAEYFSPFWAGILRRAAAKGLRIATIAHDPVRDFVLGPLWWHRLSVRQAYSFVNDVFVHDETPVDFGGFVPERIRIHLIPHGPYEVSPLNKERSETRDRYGFTDSDRVFLSFGQIRDGKNLDRFLKAMPHLPGNVKLLVAGAGGAASQRSPETYVNLARELGVANRCAWDFRYIPNGETGDLLAASDHLLLTYSARFRSASGVLNTAVTSRKSVLASSGDGPLRTAVDGYQLGYFVPPDDDAAILEGAKRLISTPLQPAWDRYLEENSWEQNAQRVISALTSNI